MEHLKAGFEFDHPRVLDEECKPMKYKVIRIANGIVYFKALDKDCVVIGAPECITEDKFELWLNNWKAALQ